MSNLLYYVVWPFGRLMQLLFDVFGNYGIALLIFTILTRLVMLPTSISQQKSMAKMSVYNPIIQEVQKKYANNREKQQEEMTKLYTEYGIKPSMGCGAMVFQLAFVMILYQVIQKPLLYMVGLSSVVYDQVVEVAKTLQGCPATYVDTFIINQIQNGNDAFAGIIDAAQHAKIETLDFSFFGIGTMDLTGIPSFKPATLLIIIPILSAISMIASQFITSKVTGQKMQGGMGVVMYGMSIWIGYLGFTFPAALSLYWFYSNIFGLIQSIVLRKFYNPDIIKEQIQAELAAKRAEKKAKKTVTITDESTGEKVTKEMNEAELTKVRLAKARAMQEEKYRQMSSASAKQDDNSVQTEEKK